MSFTSLSFMTFYIFTKYFLCPGLLYSSWSFPLQPCQILSSASSSMTELPRITTMPILFACWAPCISTASSITKFMNGSKPRRIPWIERFPFNFNDNLLSIYFFNSGGWAFDIIVPLWCYCYRNIIIDFFCWTAIDRINEYKTSQRCSGLSNSINLNNHGKA